VSALTYISLHGYGEGTVIPLVMACATSFHHGGCYVFPPVRSLTVAVARIIHRGMSQLKYFPDLFGYDAEGVRGHWCHLVHTMFMVV